jgi:gliding motility-associated-like protein
LDTTKFELTIGPDVDMCNNDVNVTAIIKTENKNFSHYQWNTGDTTYYLITDNPGTYILKTTYLCGNKYDTIQVIGCPPDDTYDLFIPNAFTPNDDGLNDVWSLQFRNILINRASVYDRWGNKVFECVDCGNVDWDGTFKSKPIHGVFNYIIDAEVLESSRKIIKKGNITVI